MKRLRALVLRLAGLFGGARRERELADELDSHLQMNIDDNLRAGLTQEEARRQAMLRLDGVEKTKQAYRERGTLPLVENLVGDLRFAVRQLVKHPGFAATAIVVLALGIGASVAIFGFVDAALLEPLPYTNPRQLMSVNESSVESRRWPLSYPASSIVQAFPGPRDVVGVRRWTVRCGLPTNRNLPRTPAQFPGSRAYIFRYQPHSKDAF
jgi:hypothetical protein